MTSTLARSLALAALIGASVAGGYVRLAVESSSIRRRLASAAPSHPATDMPDTLRATGFFSYPRLPFAPQYPLWSDGATKRRWIFVPPGAHIDASDIDAWRFPVGTRLWKELSFGGHPVETRYITRAADGWHYATYVWDTDGRDAARAPDRGSDGPQIAPGVRHRIPSTADCRACHANGPTPVLGFSALQLSPDRDPNALHAEKTPPGGLDLRVAVETHLVAGVPARLLAEPPRIPGPPIERAALGYLHANCGICHRADGPLGSVGMELTSAVYAPGAAKRTTIGMPAHFHAPALRIAASDPAHSVVIERMSSRSAVDQMPPLGTQLVDIEATRLLTSWIEQLQRRD